MARAIELLEKLQESGDVPAHKLQSLKKVLQSEFCTAIREVGPEGAGQGVRQGAGQRSDHKQIYFTECANTSWLQSKFRTLPAWALPQFGTVEI